MLHRPLICPICGFGPLMVATTKESEESLPKSYVLPEHVPGAGGNLCEGYVVTVTLDWDKCASCGHKMGKHPSGLCIRCFEEVEKGM